MLIWLTTITSVKMFGCSQFRSPLHRLGFSTSISSLLSSGPWYSWFCTFLVLPTLPRCRLFRFSIREQICPLPFLLCFFFSLFKYWSLPSPSCNGLVSLKYHRRHHRSYLCVLLSMMLLVEILALALVCNALLCTEDLLLCGWCCLPSSYGLSISCLWGSLLLLDRCLP